MLLYNFAEKVAEKVPGLNKVTGRSEDREAAEVAGAVAEAIAGPVFDTLNTLSESDYSTDDVVCFWNSWKVGTIWPSMINLTPSLRIYSLQRGKFGRMRVMAL